MQKVGESEKALANAFQKAKENVPCVVFIDELESIFKDRDTSGDVSLKV